ncbi:uncharacterized protein EV154DRAFT_567818 [Mucor mucedo]|uniref:uncharacterized protein n=1 Tax=Mucor mucedo TaxID=29922 RepID=UPI00221FDCD2|nr:uncharacterized protein EV154DRAFT_567818 [Mucor mucedo]KAI7884989.1 hypothetical protein EV154DRAFT_567818 [Mucor mucedo]
MDYTSTNKRRHTLPSISFVDPAIVRFIEKASSSTCSVMEEEEEEEEEEDDDQRTTITTLSLPQTLSYPPYKQPINHLDTLWARQEKYDNLDLRLLSLEVTKKRFEQRLQALEEQDNNRPILLHQKPPMKPDQQPIMHETHDEMIKNNSQYIELYNKHQQLLNKYHSIQAEFEEKEAMYKKRIEELTHPAKEEEEDCSYKEEDGYLIFDTTNMNGEIIHCRVKIPNPSSLVSPPATRVNSPQQIPPTPLPSSIIPKKKKGLNFNAPEWKT